jgi:hypothetical protein
MRSNLVAIKVSDCHLISVICVAVRAGGPSEEVEAECPDLGQHAV